MYVQDKYIKISYEIYMNSKSNNAVKSSQNKGLIWEVGKSPKIFRFYKNTKGLVNTTLPTKQIN